MIFISTDYSFETRSISTNYSYLCGFNTPAGNDVIVQPNDTETGLQPITLTFSTVSQSGTTTLNLSSSGPTPPNGFSSGDPAKYYNISTTATFSGNIQICIDYSNINYDNESVLKLFQYENGQWIDITTSLDTFNDKIYGVASSLPTFAIFEPLTLEDLIQIVRNSTTIKEEIRNSLLKKLQNALESVERGNIGTAINQIEAFQNEVRAQRGKKIPADLADEWIQISNVIIANL